MGNYPSSINDSSLDRPVNGIFTHFPITSTTPAAAPSSSSSSTSKSSDTSWIWIIVVIVVLLGGLSLAASISEQRGQR